MHGTYVAHVPIGVRLDKPADRAVCVSFGVEVAGLVDNEQFILEPGETAKQVTPVFIGSGPMTRLAKLRADEECERGDPSTEATLGQPNQFLLQPYTG